jgi:serine/threonine-protein kinase
MTWHWQRWAQVTPGLAHVLTRMLSYAPGDRYSSADEVAHALETMNQPGAVQGVPQPAPPPAPPERTVAAVGKPPSQMATVAAVGNRERPANRDDYNDDYRPGQSVPPRQSSLWDDPFAVISVGLGLMVIAGIGTWAAFNAITRSPKPAPEPTPIASIEPSPSPSATPTPKPSPSPMVYSQRLNLKAGESATRNELLKQGDTLNLTFDGEEGQTLDAKITGEGVLMTVIAPNGNPVSESAKRVSAWQGELPFTGQYTLQMRPVQGLEKGDLKLDASLKAKPIATPTPTPTPAATPTPSPTDSPDPDPDATTQTQRVLIAPGQTATTIPGQASAKVTQRYLVKARGGQSLKVAVSGGAKLTLRYPDGSPIEDATGIIEYSGQLPDNGDYMIDVSSGSPTDFQLNVEVQ